MYTHLCYIYVLYRKFANDSSNIRFKFRVFSLDFLKFVTEKELYTGWSKKKFMMESFSLYMHIFFKKLELSKLCGKKVIGL